MKKNSFDDFFEFLEKNFDSIEHIIIQRPQVWDGKIISIDNPYLTIAHGDEEPRTFDIRNTSWISIKFDGQLKKEDKQFHF